MLLMWTGLKCSVVLMSVNHSAKLLQELTAFSCFVRRLPLKLFSAQDQRIQVELAACSENCDSDHRVRTRAPPRCDRTIPQDRQRAESEHCERPRPSPFDLAAGRTSKGHGTKTVNKLRSSHTRVCSIRSVTGIRLLYGWNFIAALIRCRHCCCNDPADQRHICQYIKLEYSMECIVSCSIIQVALRLFESKRKSRS